MNVRTVAGSAVRTSFAAIALTTASLLAVPALHAQFGLSVTVGYTRVAPPPLVEVEQPVAPGDGYIWTPGYWAWDDSVQDYYWVDGEWVMAPEPGLLWTPGYWAFDNGGYRWNDGYWGEHVGFYGGVNYGFGYSGSGYDGGYWQGNRFYYNTIVNRVDLNRMRYTYQRPVAYRYSSARVAFNGGPGGITVRPSRGEEMAFREQHFQATRDQQRGWQQAHEDSGRGWNDNRGNARNGWNGDRSNQTGGRDGFHADRGSDRDRDGSRWTGDQTNDRGRWDGNNGFRSGGGNQPPATNQPGNGRQGGWQGNPGDDGQRGGVQGSRGNGGQQPPTGTQPGGFRWNGPGDGNNRPTPNPPVTRPFPGESRGGGGAPGQPPVNGGGNRGAGGGQQQPPQQPRPQGGANFGGGDRPSFQRGGPDGQVGSGIRSFGRF